MIFKNGRVFTGTAFEGLDVGIAHGVIMRMEQQLPYQKEKLIDLTGKYLVPGFIDVHTHGCMGYDFSTAAAEEIEIMSRYYYSRGITSVAATTMTMDYQAYKKAAKTIGDYMETQKNHNLVGINMEGPFISKEKKGAHDEQYILPVNEEKLLELNRLSNNHFLLVDVAPELAGAIPLIEKYHSDFIFSLAHTEADYETAQKAFRAGATQVTHLFNAMNGLAHRSPGVIGAAFDSGANVEVICDGIHIHPTVLKMVMQMMQKQVVTISDSMSACGLADGEYELGGQKVYVQGNRATLADGTIAGSTTDILTALRLMVQEWGIELAEALQCVTSHPAKAIGKDEEIGSIRIGKQADLVVLSQELEVEQVYKKGVRIL